MGEYTTYTNRNRGVHRAQSSFCKECVETYPIYKRKLRRANFLAEAMRGVEDLELRVFKT